MSEKELRRYSRVVVDGNEQAPSRAMLRAVGFTEDDFRRPQIGIASTWSMVTPCNMHIDRLADKAAEGADAAGCTRPAPAAQGPPLRAMPPRNTKSPCVTPKAKAPSAMPRWPPSGSSAQAATASPRPNTGSRPCMSAAWALIVTP